MSLNKVKLGLLPRIVIAIALGIVGGLLLPEWIQRIFATFNSLFGNFLNFFVPLLIVGLIVPGIANVGRNAGKLLLVTLTIAYTFTVLSGMYTWGFCELIYPTLLDGAELKVVEQAESGFTPYFVIDMPPIMGVMSALVASFLIGMGITAINGESLRGVFNDFQDIILLTISKVVIPLLPLYIFGIFLSISSSEQILSVLGLFIKLILVIFLFTALLLVLQFSVAGIVARRNPFKMLKSMLVAYVTALGTQSSAATIPVTLEQTIKNGVNPSIAGFVIPLCATIHLSGSTTKITACAIAIMMMLGMDIDPITIVGFIFMLGITMVAAPGVPGGAIMASIGVLQSILGFDQTSIALMIALYIAMDSFGTAANVTGDGAIAVIIDKLSRKHNMGGK